MTLQLHPRSDAVCHQSDFYATACAMVPSAPLFLGVFCASEQYSSALRGQKALTECIFPDGEKDFTVALGKNIVK